VEQDRLDEIDHLSSGAPGSFAFVWYGWRGTMRKDEREGLRWWQPASKLYRFTAR
jgi:hypothetical protein